MYNSIQKRVIKNTVILSLSSIISKLVLLIAFVIIAREFGPANFGNYSIAINYLAIFGILSKLGFDMTIIRMGAKDIQNIDNLQEKVFPIRFWFAVISMLLCATFIFILNYDNVIIKLTILMSPIIFSGGAVGGGLLEHYSTTYRVLEKMEYVGYVLIARVVCFTLILILLFSIDFLTIYTISVAILLSSFISLYIQFRNNKKMFNNKMSLSIDWIFFKKIIKPVILFGIASLLYDFSIRMNVLLLGLLDNESSAGYYSASWQILSAGLIFISSFSMSMFPNTARNIFKSKYRKKMLIGLIKLAIILFILCLVGTFVSHYVIELLYSDTYSASVLIFNIVIWFIPIRILSLWGHQILEASNYLKLRIVIFIIPIIINVILGMILIPKYSYLGAAWATLVSNFVLLLLAFISALIITSKDNRFKNEKNINLDSISSI